MSSLFDNISFLLSTWIFNTNVFELQENQELVITFLACIFCLFVLGLPFMIVWWIIKRFL